MNPFLKLDRVVVSDKESMFVGNKGTVKYTFESSVEVSLDNKTVIVISANKLKKLKKK
jgi:hypothetical protein